MTATLPEMSPAWIVPPKKTSCKKVVAMGSENSGRRAEQNTLWLLSLSVCARLEKVVGEASRRASTHTRRG